MQNNDLINWGDRVLKEYSDTSKELKQELVLFCRLTKCFKEANHRVTLAFGGSEAGRQLQGYVAVAFKELEYEHRSGRAPPSHQERELQSFIEEVTSS